MPDGGGGKTEKQSVSNQPWSGQQPYLTNLFKRAEGLYGQGPISYYPGDTRAGLSPTSQSALEGISARGQQGSPLNAAAGGYITDTLSGKYLGADAPGLNVVQDRITQAAGQPFQGAGRYGSGLHQGAIADSIGALEYGRYQDERNRMGGAAALAPTIAGQDFIDLNAMLGAGDRYQQELQGEIASDVDRYNYEQQAPWQNLQAYQDFIQGQYGGQQVSRVPSSSAGSGQQILGGGLALASLFADAYGGP